LNIDADTLDSHDSTYFAVHGGAEHDEFSDFVANEHVDHSSVSIIAGTGLSGGGDITSSRTLNCDITQYTDELAQDAIGNILDDGTVGEVIFTYDDSTPKISAVVQDGEIDHNALNNTHNLTTDIDHDSLTNTHNLTTDIDHDSLTNTHNLTTDIDHDSLTNFSADEHVAHSTVTLTAGTGLTGGGDISANRTFDVDVGIADNKIVQVDGTPADDEYAKWTASGLEGRSYAQVLSDLSGQAGAAFDWNDQDLANVKNISGNFRISKSNLSIGFSPNLLKSKYSDFQSFENGDEIGCPPYRCTAKCDTSDFYIGDRCLKMVSSGPGAYVYLSSSSADYYIRVKPSTKYIVSCYAKSSTGTPQIRIDLVQDNGSGKAPAAQNITTSWTRYEFIIQTDANLTDSAFIVLVLLNSGYTVWIDAIQVEEASSATSPEASPYKPGGIMARKDVLKLKERTTPPAETDYGKIYTKNDNKLYFQDGAGVEHEVAFV